ncbi:hypothetical protein NESM_000904500 [Novymonas esmeraldas]|uniref:Uncharacterized protein n=1 Tax=Novymonas esmeraldas TaxID=1808958 RepID=A0AAW0F0B5_9TRYP
MQEHSHVLLQHRLHAGQLGVGVCREQRDGEVQRGSPRLVCAGHLSHSADKPGVQRRVCITVLRRWCRGGLREAGALRPPCRPDGGQHSRRLCGSRLSAGRRGHRRRLRLRQRAALRRLSEGGSERRAAEQTLAAPLLRPVALLQRVKELEHAMPRRRRWRRRCGRRALCPPRQLMSLGPASEGQLQLLQHLQHARRAERRRHPRAQRGWCKGVVPHVGCRSRRHRRLGSAAKVLQPISASLESSPEGLTRAGGVHCRRRGCVSVRVVEECRQRAPQRRRRSRRIVVGRHRVLQARLEHFNRMRCVGGVSGGVGGAGGSGDGRRRRSVGGGGGRARPLRLHVLEREEDIMSAGEGLQRRHGRGAPLPLLQQRLNPEHHASDSEMEVADQDQLILRQRRQRLGHVGEQRGRSGSGSTVVPTIASCRRICRGGRAATLAHAGVGSRRVDGLQSVQETPVQHRKPRRHGRRRRCRGAVRRGHGRRGSGGGARWHGCDQDVAEARHHLIHSVQQERVSGWRGGRRRHRTGVAEAALMLGAERPKTLLYERRQGHRTDDVQHGS